MTIINRIFAFFLSLFSLTPPVSGTAAATATPQPAQTRFVSPSAALSLVRSINATEFGNFFDPYDVMAIITIESSFDSYAERFEVKRGEASVGLMQILPSSAADRGFAGTPDMLFDVRTNIRYGMRQLKWSYDYLRGRLGKAPSKVAWIESYNEGVGNVMRGVNDAAYWNKFAQARVQYP